MIIYIELFLLTNMIVHLLTIFLVGKILGLQIRKKVWLSTVVDLIFMYFYIENYAFFRLLIIPILFLLVNLSYKLNIKDFFQAVIIYFLLNLMLGGMSFILKVSGNLFYLLTMLSYIILTFSIYIILVNKKIEIYYEIRLILPHTLRLKAFYDTGCHIFYRNKPVLIINRKKAFKVDYCGEILINSVTGTEIIPCFHIKDVLINDRHYEAYGVFLDVEFEAIIGASFV